MKLKGIYCTTKAVQGPITKINQSDRSIAGPIFSKYWTGYCPEWSRVASRIQLKIKMADADDIVRKICCKTPEWVVDFEGPSFSLGLEFLKETTSELAPARETSIKSNTSTQAEPR